MGLGLARTKPRQNLLESAHMPAPVGGLNTVDVASNMPGDDCLVLWNLIPAEYGLRSRLGFEEWATGLAGGVLTTLPFTGSHKSGATNKLFGCTSVGIIETTTPTASPTTLVTFGNQTGDAGYGVSCPMATPAGRFLLHCDEENGLYVYTETAGTWAKVSLGVSEVWRPSTAYTATNKVVNGGKVYVVASISTDGISASSGGPTGTGTSISDGNVVWDYVGVAPTAAIGPSLADQQNGFTGDPANFCFAAVWKNRVWFVEKDTSRAWYLGVNSVYGVATSFDFGSKMQHGGPLVGLYNWSEHLDNGIDTMLVGISGAGDVVAYQGTDPTSISTFGLKGCGFVGGVPYGRRIATDYGGDVLILSVLGIIPLSKLMAGAAGGSEDTSLYATGKIANLFNVLVSTYGHLPGWSIHIHPTDNVLLVTVPTAAGAPTVQLAMSFSGKRGWARYRGLPITSAAVWNNVLYFGTDDGRVCVNQGYVDNVKLDDPNHWTPVEWSLLTAYQNLGNARNKMVVSVRPTVLSEAPTPVVEAFARYNFNLDEPNPPAGAPAIGQPGTWDTAVWDTSLWSGEYTPAQPMQGTTGMGRDVALAIRGTAISRTILVGIDVLFQQGGLL